MKTIKDICFSATADDSELFCLDLYLPDSYEGHADLSNTAAENLMFCELYDADTYTCARDNTVDKNAFRIEQRSKIRELADQISNTNVKVKPDSTRERDLVCNCCTRRDRYNCQTENENSLQEQPPNPLVVFIHGGGWRRGARDAWKHYLYYDVNFLVSFLQYLVRTYSNVGEALAVNGIPCAVISYPLTEASLAVVMFEMLLSYIQCCFFTFLVGIPFTLLTMLNCSVFFSTYGGYTSWDLVLHDHRETGIISIIVLIILLITNCATLMIIIFKRRHFRLSSRQCFLFVLSLSMSTTVIMFVASGVQMLLCCLNVVTIVITQGSILRVRLSRQRRTHKDQLKVVSSAVRWAKTFCDKTGIGSRDSLYLMGHSAGGHLATIATLSPGVLDGGIKIKGVISVSGVYDLLCLNRALLKPMYLLPTFGNKFETWLSASPYHVAKNTDSNVIQAKFLLMSAEKDLFLKQQSLDFYGVLESKGVNCEHAEISGTNHFSIITGTNTDSSSPLGLAIDFIRS